MKLASFTIRNFRSITEARKIPLEANTVLIGPNNEGKSNILRALALAMNVVTGERLPGSIGRRFRRDVGLNSYNPEVDRPRGSRRRVTSIELEFELVESERLEFIEEIGSSINGTLPIVVTFKDNIPEINIAKPGRGNATLNGKRDKIVRFLAGRIQFQYIPAVRTAESAAVLVEEIVGSELRLLESEPEYRDAVEKIRSLQKPLLEEISRRATETLKRFVPAISAVDFAIDELRRSTELRRSISITVDDGVVTPLAQKGDGIQSLIALGIRHHVSETARKNQSYIFAVEEPEAHLHSNATHELKRVLDEISTNDQLIITTHSTVFVNRSDLKCNVIVNKNIAKIAKKIQEVRDVLGVRASENLIGAEVVLLVEGATDKKIMRSWLAEESAVLGRALDSGRLILEELGSASTLAYKAQLFKALLCKIHCLLDSDESGKRAYEAAQSASLITERDTTFAIYPGLVESELEDLIARDFYAGRFGTEFGLDFSQWRGAKSKRKWSARLGEFFLAQGRPFDDAVLKKAKSLLVSECDAGPVKFNDACMDLLRRLVVDLEAKLS